MNKWSAIVIIFVLLMIGFVFVSESEPAFLPQFTSFFVDVVVAVFGIAVIVIIVKFVRDR
jgi:hypothetical protein